VLHAIQQLVGAISPLNVLEVRAEVRQHVGQGRGRSDALTCREFRARVLRQLVHGHVGQQRLRRTGGQAAVTRSEPLLQLCSMPFPSCSGGRLHSLRHESSRRL